MTAPRAPASLSAHLIPTDIRLGRFVLRPSGQPDSEGRFRWALHGPGSMGVVRRFTHTYTVAIAAVATEAANREGLDLGSDRATVTTPAVEVPMSKPTPPVGSPSARRSERSRAGGLARAAKAKAAKAAKAAPAVVKAGEAMTKAPTTRADHPHPEVILREERIAELEARLGEANAAIHDALDVNKALPDGHPGHAIRRAIREAGAAGVAALEEASRLRAELTAIVTSSGVRIEGAEDLEPVEAVRRVIAELRRPEPVTLDQVERALNDLDARRQVLLDRRAHLAAVSRARARLALAEEAARVAAAELEAARAEAASLA